MMIYELYSKLKSNQDGLIENIVKEEDDGDLVSEVYDALGKGKDVKSMSNEEIDEELEDLKGRLDYCSDTGEGRALRRFYEERIEELEKEKERRMSEARCNLESKTVVEMKLSDIAKTVEEIHKNKEYQEAIKAKEEAQKKFDEIYAKVTKERDEKVIQYADEAIKKIAALIGAKRVADLGRPSGLREVFLEPFEKFTERKVSVHIIPSKVYAGESPVRILATSSDDSTLMVRNEVAGPDIRLIIPESATPDDIVKAVNILKPFLDATEEVPEDERKKLIDKVGWKQEVREGRALEMKEGTEEYYEGVAFVPEGTASKVYKELVKYLPPSAGVPRTYREYKDAIKEMEGKEFKFKARKGSNRVLLYYPEPKDNTVGLDIDKKFLIIKSSEEDKEAREGKVPNPNAEEEEKIKDLKEIAIKPKKIEEDYVQVTKKVRVYKVYKGGVDDYSFDIPSDVAPYDEKAKDKIGAVSVGLEKFIEILKTNGYSDEEVDVLLDELRAVENLKRVDLPKPVVVEVDFFEWKPLPGKKEVEEQEEKYTVVAKGISDKEVAQKIATDKKGIVVTDDQDPKKFKVIVKESFSAEDVEEIIKGLKAQLESVKEEIAKRDKKQVELKTIKENFEDMVKTIAQLTQKGKSEVEDSLKRLDEKKKEIVEAIGNIALLQDMKVKSMQSELLERYLEKK